MKIKILQMGNMSHNGEYILKSLGNSPVDDLDLLVRESIQNSLDAGTPGKDVYFDISLGEFMRDDLIDVLEDTKSLKNIVTNNKSNYISISDKNTKGLTGPLSYRSAGFDDDKGNLLKLVYSMGQAQIQEGAGGSWGKGKSLFYRIGKGIVLYYSRINLSPNKYEERLVGVLVENQNDINTILDHRKNKGTGIAWWGEYDEFDDIIPITDSSKIKSILNIFGIEQYNGQHVGTTVIVPFINEEKLFNEATINNEYGPIFYNNNIVDYLKYSVQRWYFPRLNNPKYNIGKKNNLIVSINGEFISNYDEHKFFKLLRGMYNLTFDKNDKELVNLLGHSDFHTKEIQLVKTDNLNGRHVGNFIYGKFNYKDVGMMNSGDIGNPIFLSNTNKEHLNSDDRTNPPMVLYTRQPGMIVNYDSISQWVSNVPHTPNDEYIIGFFVLNSSNEIYLDVINNFGKAKLTLEDYVRSSELEDHMEWNDKKLISHKGKSFNPNIVSRFIRNVSSELRNKFFNIKIESESSNVTKHISNYLGDILPSFGYGSTAGDAPRKPRGTGSGKRRIKRFDFTLNTKDISYSLNDMKIPFEIKIYNPDVSKINIQLFIKGELGNIKIDFYEDSFKVKSPISIGDIKINNPKIKYDIEDTLIYKSSYAFTLHSLNHVESQIITGEILVRNSDKNIMPSIIAKEELEDE